MLDGQSVVRERQGASNTATYLHGLRGPEYRRNDSSSAVRWYLYDGLGSVLGETDSSGNITASRKYDVYGGVRASTGTSTSNHKFVGALGHPSEDGTGLVYMRARYYDPVAGRFASEDAVQDGVNWFAYCSSNPINLVDRDGRTEGSVGGSVMSIAIGNFINGAILGVAGYVLKSLFFGTPMTLKDALLFGLIGGLLKVGGAYLPAGAAMAQSALGVGRALLTVLGEGAATPGIGGLAAIGAAMLGLTALAAAAMRDDDDIVDVANR